MPIVNGCARQRLALSRSAWCLVVALFGIMLFDLTTLNRNGKFGTLCFLGVYQTQELTEQGKIAKSFRGYQVTKRHVQEMDLSSKVQDLMVLVYNGKNKTTAYGIRPMAYIMSGVTHVFALKVIWLEAEVRRIVNRLNSQWKPTAASAGGQKSKRRAKSLTDAQVRREIRLVQPSASGRITPPDRKQGRRLALTSSEEEQVAAAILPPDDEFDPNIMPEFNNLQIGQQEELPNPNAIVENFAGDTFADWAPDLIAAGMIIPSEMQYEEKEEIKADERMLVDKEEGEPPVANQPLPQPSSSDDSMAPVVDVEKPAAVSSSGFTSSDASGADKWGNDVAKVLEDLPQIEAAASGPPSAPKPKRQRIGKNVRFWFKEDFIKTTFNTDELKETIDAPRQKRLDRKFMAAATWKEMQVQRQIDHRPIDIHWRPHVQHPPSPQALSIFKNIVCSPIGTETFRQKRKAARRLLAVEQPQLEEVEGPMQVEEPVVPMPMIMEDFEPINNEFEMPGIDVPPVVEEVVALFDDAEVIITGGPIDEPIQREREEGEASHDAQPMRKSKRASCSILEEIAEEAGGKAAKRFAASEYEPPQEANKTTIDDLLKDTVIKGCRSINFTELFPPESTGRQEAAKAFFELITQRKALGVKIVQKPPVDNETVGAIRICLPKM